MRMAMDQNEPRVCGLICFGHGFRETDNDEEWQDQRHHCSIIT